MQSSTAKALKKASGALTVSVTLDEKVGGKKPTEVEILSSILRRSKIASLFVPQELVRMFAEEQKTAKGNFPGPCPLVLREVVSDAEHIELAASNGASAVIVRAGHADASSLCEQAKKKGLSVIWEVESAEEMKSCEEKGENMLLVDEKNADILSGASKTSVIIGRVSAMQAQNEEVKKSRDMQSKGCCAIVLEDAVVGDGEDLPYVRWAMEAILSKASTEFKITGMTGHVNGHYGTGTFERSDKQMEWKRKQA
ncbi:hypothetical protein GUITHDRAFT_63469 [Guillardia theta CCMP2712]|uniref:Uncharacterized protein n=1 Tax=Guillardia theta (strain CCMP2712) TaxID=905079 RepID=L1K155_GUITC|nr:hypothetical protein GUITHDRAFT_63469 [Guillardia theta CCMP2712]EKX54586.1 hypothetical protein GUITHDRAFT_63469 [Guillardia theta CCMP2712]|eukprot:XP_005841566.1 hypothetical protein GUITHDRAFT_63469 [Guillardia theta CCMP2712]